MPLQVVAKSNKPRNACRPITTAALKVRPYTVRKGDTFESIAQKRGTVTPGQEILLGSTCADPIRLLQD